jgi:tetratricopeptide (TPR) repeat protein
LFNPVLWTIDNDFDPFLFERLCTDLMFRNGYTNIVPFGRTRDRGRDAQISLYKGNYPNRSDRIFFQYSLEKTWESKLKREINKIKSYDQQIVSLVFVTSQNVSGEKRDKLEYDFREYEYELIIFDREWLRLQLEEANKDLAQKYLGIPANILLPDPREGVKPSIPFKEQLEEAWMLFVLGNYEQALPKFKEILGTGFDVYVWRGVAWCHYISLNYKEALRAIEKSLLLEPESRESLCIKGCILAEAGISENSRTKLALSKNIFLNLVEHEKSWIIHYNLGNVLSGLQEYDEARKVYFKAIEENSEIAEIWSNLGNCFHHIKEHEKELSCFDKAIYLNPNLSQSFISKANTLGKVYGKYEEAIEILDFTLERDPNLDREFPHFWYWRTQFLLEIDEMSSALESVESGLINSPDEECLLDLKSYILGNLWQTESSYFVRAKQFFEMRAYSTLNDYRPFIALAQIHKANNDLENVSKCIKSSINILSPMQAIDDNVLTLLEFSSEEMISSILHIADYERFRDVSRITALHFIEDLDEINIYIYKLSWICSLVSFNDLFHFFLENVKEKDKLEQEDKIEVETTTLEAFKRNLLNISRDIIKIANVIGILYSNQHQQVKIQIMTYLILVLPEVALVESSRQFGYLAGLYEISPNILEKVQSLAEGLLKTWIDRLSLDVIQTVNAHFLLLSDSTGSDSCAIA